MTEFRKVATNSELPILCVNDITYVFADLVLAFVAGRYMSVDEVHSVLFSYNVPLTIASGEREKPATDLYNRVRSGKKLKDPLLLLDSDAILLCQRMRESKNLSPDEKLHGAIVQHLVGEPSDSWQKEAECIIDELWGDDRLWVFRTPVDATDTNYHDSIKHPMDLSTLKNSITTISPLMFGQYLKLIWTNAMTYNNKCADAYKDAQLLCSIVKRKLRAYHDLYAVTRICYSASDVCIREAPKRKKDDASKHANFDFVSSGHLVIGETCHGSFARVR
jgi:hypothetical protein